MAAARKRQNNFSLDQLGPSDTYLTEDQAEQIHEIVNKIKQSFEDQSSYITNLQKKFKLVLKPKDPTQINKHVNLGASQINQVQSAF
jgi:hypothetical protein